jgi:hypothetical protein
MNMEEKGSPKPVSSLKPEAVEDMHMDPPPPYSESKYDTSINKTYLIPQNASKNVLI